MPLDPDQHGEVDRWGRDTRDTVARRVFDRVYRSWFRVEWEGLEHVPKTGGALLVSNHAGMLPVDGGVIWHGIERELARPVYMLAHHGFFRFPYFGPILNRMGAVVANPDNAHRLLCEDEGLVLVFPEGEKGPVKPIAQRYRLQRFGRGGFIKTAMDARVPIVPIVLVGTEDTTPTIANLELAGQRFPLTLNAMLLGPLLGAMAQFPAKIRARVLPPVRFDESPAHSRHSQSVLMNHAEAIRGDMQGALDEMLAARKSIWFG